MSLTPADPAGRAGCATVVRAPDRGAVRGRARCSTRPTRRWSSSAPTWSPRCGSRPAASGWPRRSSAWPAQAFCVDVSSHPKTRTSHGLIVLLNAEVVEASRYEKGREGCMSVPDLTGDVKRATKITVAGRAAGDRRAGR